jgi:hypothetical protein
MDNETRYIVNVSVLITSVTHDLDPPQLYHIIISHQKHKKYGLCFDDHSRMDNNIRYIVNVSVLMTSATHDPYPPQLYDGNIS